jgi:hypothetical protein
MIATVRVALTRGEVGVVGVVELWKASSVVAEMPRSLWSDMVIRKVGCVKRNGKIYHRREEEKYQADRPSERFEVEEWVNEKVWRVPPTLIYDR